MIAESNALIIDQGRICHVHLVGIGGIGMGGLAQVLLDRGLQVSGSDLTENQVVSALKKRGASITLGHDLGHLDGIDLVVYSSAIKASNPIFHIAQDKGIPLMRRAEMLAALVKANRVIAVAGTHGKTTTSGLIGEVLHQSGFPVGRFIGGFVKGGAVLAADSQNDWTVIEADESDASLLTLEPELAVLTNVEPDHLENYPGGFPQIIETFRQFLKQLKPSGRAFVCLDCPGVEKVIDRLGVPITSYGFDERSDVQITQYVPQGDQVQITIRGIADHLITVTSSLIGRHHAQNICAGLLVAKELGYASSFAENLPSFYGMARRFHQHGDWVTDAGRVRLLEDYGHHPRELAVTVAAARELWPSRRLMMVFQPHRYSRTALLLSDFADVLTQLDHVVLLPVYSAGEEPSPEGTSEALHQQCLKESQQCSRLDVVRRDDCVLTQIKMALQDGDVLIMQGAGDIGILVQHIVSSDQFFPLEAVLC